MTGDEPDLHLSSAARLLRNAGEAAVLERLGFGFLALNSFAVVLDIVVFPSLDFQLLRHLASLGAVSVLLVGFVWDIE